MKNKEQEYISGSEFREAFDYLWNNQNNEIKEYFKILLFNNDTSIARVIKKYRELKNER